MTIKHILTGAVLSASSIALFSSCSGKKTEETAEAPVLRFSAIPDEDTTAQRERFQPVADYLSKKLGVKVEFVPSASYGASVEKFKSGDIQLAWFGGVSGVKARKAVEGGQAIVSGEADLQFKSYFIAHTSTGLTRSESFPTEIKDLKFTYGSSGSTSGCVMPTHFLMEATGQSYTEFFSQPVSFSGSHDKTAALVNDGTFQAGALNYKTYDKGIANGTLSKDNCIVIWETPPYADYNMTAHPVLEEKFGKGFITKLQDALVNCDDEAALGALKRQKLVKVTNETFAGIAGVMKAIEESKK